jgi:hypothetical protein
VRQGDQPRPRADAGGVGGIERLRRDAEHDHGIAAECLLQLLTFDPQSEDPEERVRSLAGALFIAEGLYDLKALRRALTRKAG